MRWRWVAAALGLTVLTALAVTMVISAVASHIRQRQPSSRRLPPPSVPPPARGVAPVVANKPANALSAARPAGEAHEGFLYGRITTVEGKTSEGRLRFGGDAEAFWDDYFNGFKRENRWAAHVPAGQLPKRREKIEILGIEIGHWYEQIGLHRRFMARFGDIARIDSIGRVIRVTLKTGTVFDVDRFSANDLDNGVRVWDRTGGVVRDVESKVIRTIEFLPTPPLEALPGRLHGTVRTRLGEFMGFVRWDRDECVGSDELDGRTAGGEFRARFDTIRSIASRSRDSSLVTLLDGREIELSGRQVGHGNRGIYVDDDRYGRVVIYWDAFERIDFSPAGSGPGYGNFSPGRTLTGSVTTRAGSRLTGRLVYDLDESETEEMLNAASPGIEYTIPFGLIASLTPCGREERGAAPASMTLHNGEALQPGCTGDLGAENAGMLIFVDGHPRPQYVPWSDVKQVQFDRPPMMYPPLPRLVRAAAREKR